MGPERPIVACLLISLTLPPTTLPLTYSTPDTMASLLSVSTRGIILPQSFFSYDFPSSLNVPPPEI